MNIYVYLKDYYENNYYNIINKYFLRIKKYNNINIIENIDEFTYKIDNSRKSFLIGIKNNVRYETTSMEFANIINSFLINGYTDIFIISENIMKKNFDLILCITNMNVSHSITNLLLMEQFYRAFKIINNEEYHK